MKVPEITPPTRGGHRVKRTCFRRHRTQRGRGSRNEGRPRTSAVWIKGTRVSLRGASSTSLAITPGCDRLQLANPHEPDGAKPLPWPPWRNRRRKCAKPTRTIAAYPRTAAQQASRSVQLTQSAWNRHQSVVCKWLSSARHHRSEVEVNRYEVDDRALGNVILEPAKRASEWFVRDTSMVG